jgi:hypothetical protein
LVGGKKGGAPKVEVRIEGSKIMSPQVLQVVPHEPWIGSWWKTRHRRKILLDDDAATEERFTLSLAVHEVVEKWVYETFFKGRPIEKVYPTCHRIAQNMERRFHKQKWGAKSWNEYSDVVNKAHRKELRYKAKKQEEGKGSGK